MKFYREKRGTGDYLVVFDENGSRWVGGEKMWDGRATAIDGLVTSCATTGMSRGYLKSCRRVRPSEIPEDWLLALIGEEATKELFAACPQCKAVKMRDEFTAADHLDTLLDRVQCPNCGHRFPASGMVNHA